MTTRRKLWHRPRRTTPAVICATFLLVIGAALIAASIAGQTADSPSPVRSAVADWLATLTWFGTAMLVVSTSAAVIGIEIGIVLLLAGIVPGKPNALSPAGVIDRPTGTRRRDLEAVMTRRAIGRLATEHAQHVDGVQRVSVRASGRQVRVNAETPTHYTDDVADGVHSAVSDALQHSGIRRPPRITVSVTQREMS